MEYEAVDYYSLNETTLLYLVATNLGIEKTLLKYDSISEEHYQGIMEEEGFLLDASKLSFNDRLNYNNIKKILDILKDTQSRSQTPEEKTENNYFRESREHLTDPNANFIILQNVEKNSARLIPSMKDKVEKVKPLIESKINMPNEQSTSALNTYQKENTKKKVRTLKPNLPPNFYVNTILLILLAVVLISISLIVNMDIK